MQHLPSRVTQRMGLELILYVCHHGLNTKLDGHIVADVDADAHANVTCKQSFMELLNSDVICSYTSHVVRFVRNVCSCVCMPSYRYVLCACVGVCVRVCVCV